MQCANINKSYREHALIYSQKSKTNELPVCSPILHIRFLRLLLLLYFLHQLLQLLRLLNLVPGALFPGFGGILLQSQEKAPWGRGWHLLRLVHVLRLLCLLHFLRLQSKFVCYTWKVTLYCGLKRRADLLGYFKKGNWLKMAYSFSPSLGIGFIFPRYQLFLLNKIKACNYHVKKKKFFDGKKIVWQFLFGEIIQQL